jgi:two-component system cell cycle response regulator DivK
MSPPPSADSSAPHAADRPVILVVDDYAETRRLLYFYLRATYEVVMVESAEEALAYLGANPVDLVVMDINFQDGMNGMTATERIRADPALQHLPVLATSAYAYPDDRARFLKAGFNDYIAKPIFKERMLKKVRALLAGGEHGVWVSKKDPASDDKASPGASAAQEG